MFARLSTRLLATVLVLSLAMPVGAAQQQSQIQQGIPKPTGWNLYSADQEVQLGRQAAAEVEKQVPLLPENDPLTQYVRRLGNSLVPFTPTPHYPFTFKVVNMKEINAFALPGGPVYINVGILRAASNEAEVMGVIGHEMSHVIMRHATRQATKQQVASVPLAILGAVLGQGAAGDLARLGIQMGGGLVFLKYSRSAESEADRVGARLMYDAGYNPRAMASFFETLKAEMGSGQGPQWLSSHPDPGNRAQEVMTAIRSLPKKNFSTDTGQFQTAHAEALKRNPLTSEQVAKQQQTQQPGNIENVSLDKVMPARDFKQLDHNAFRMGYPSNWQVSGDQSSAVTIAPQGAVSENAIAYGVMINGFEPHRSRTLDDAFHELLASLQQSNPDLRSIGNDEDITVNGVHAKSLDLRGVSPIKDSQGRALPEHVWLVAMPSGKLLVYAAFIAPERDYNRLAPAYESMLRTFQLKQK